MSPAIHHSCMADAIVPSRTFVVFLASKRLRGDREQKRQPFLPHACPFRRCSFKIWVKSLRHAGKIIAVVQSRRKSAVIYFEHRYGYCLTVT